MPSTLLDGPQEIIVLWKMGGMSGSLEQLPSAITRFLIQSISDQRLREHSYNSETRLEAEEDALTMCPSSIGTVHSVNSSLFPIPAAETLSMSEMGNR